MNSKTIYVSALFWHTKSDKYKRCFKPHLINTQSKLIYTVSIGQNFNFYFTEATTPQNMKTNQNRKYYFAFYTERHRLTKNINLQIIKYVLATLHPTNITIVESLYTRRYSFSMNNLLKTPNLPLTNCMAITSKIGSCNYIYAEQFLVKNVALEAGGE